jgi:lipoprotein signal peptidase
MNSRELFTQHKKTALAVFLAGALLFGEQVWHHTLIHGEIIAYTCNKGIGLGIAVNPLLYEILWVCIMATLTFLAFSNRKFIFTDHWLCFALTAIFVGAISNKMDRILYGCVIDYIPFLQLFYFNLADAAISVGAIVLLLKSRKMKIHKE